jgi:hypothetical protein
MKVAAARGKTSLKRPSDVEVASMRLVKQSKKTVSNLMVAMTMTHVAVGAFRSKGAAGVKKAAAPVRKHHIAAMCILADACSAESHVSSPHGQTPRDLLPKIMSRPEPHSQTP